LNQRHHITVTVGGGQIDGVAVGGGITGFNRCGGLVRVDQFGALFGVTFV